MLPRKHRGQGETFVGPVHCIFTILDHCGQNKRIEIFLKNMSLRFFYLMKCVIEQSSGFVAMCVCHRASPVCSGVAGAHGLGVGWGGNSITLYYVHSTYPKSISLLSELRNGIWPQNITLRKCDITKTSK